MKGLILAGGEGSRAGGRDKGLLKWRGIPLASHIAEAMGATCQDILISCNRHLDEYSAITPHCFQDIDTSIKGPLAGLFTAWHYFPDSWFLISACDTPMLTMEYSRRMCSSLPKGNAQVAWDGERRQYLHCLLRPESYPVLKEYLENGGKNVRGWLELLEPELVDFSDCPQLFTNINTLQQLDELDQA
ncbi:molybdenum cofactor guanylyltransferase [Hahella sp. CCB-MM4]|nr:molybdenum cofactor guanylyltransferase [Hahella sp. CCB-MM4]